MLGIWPLSLCLRLLCCYNVPGRERQTLDTALLLRSRNPHLNREQGIVHSWVTPRPSQDPFFTPVSSSITITAPALQRALVMGTFHLGCASGVMVAQNTLRSPSLCCVPEMQPPCRASPVAGVARIWESGKGNAIRMRGSIACRREEELGAFSNRPSLSLERTGGSCTIHLGLESHREGNDPSHDTCQRLQGRFTLLHCSGPTVCSPTGISWPAFPCVSISSAPQGKGIVWQMLHGGTDTL